MITLVLNCVMGLGGLLLSDLLSLLTWTLTQGSQWAPKHNLCSHYICIVHNI